MAQQTAVEWLQQQYNSANGFERLLTESEFEQAKAMEMEQIIDACESHADYPFDYKDFIDYYNETYGNDTQGKI